MIKFIERISKLVLFVVAVIVSIDVCAGAGKMEYKVLSLSFDTKTTTTLLSPPKISAVIGDPTDPAYKEGIYIDVLEDNKIISDQAYSVEVESNGKSIVHPDSITVRKEDGKILLKIKPSSVGYCSINIIVFRNKQTANIAIDYAVSAKTNLHSFYHTGISDASAAILINDSIMLIGDDETNQLCLYHTNKSGLPVKRFDYESYLGLNDGSVDNLKEVDVECGARSLKDATRTYWLGSMSNGGKRYDVKPNRNTLFSTTITGNSNELAINYSVGYHQLRKYLIEWGNANGYHLEESAAAGMKPKQQGGYNIEGLCFGPDSTTLYICFRAPQVPVTQRDKALIAPILNFEEWFKNGKPNSKPVFGKPIELDLDKRGFRDVIVLKDKSYLIVAGNADAERNCALYKWAGFEKDKPQNLNIDGIKELGAEAAIELLDNGKATGSIQLICDDGSTVWYNDGNPSKNLDPKFKKFRSVVVKINETK